MPTLTGCMRKAGAALNDTDKAAVQGRFNELTAGGMKPKAAANQALDDRMAYLRERLAAVESGAEVEPETQVSTWTDTSANPDPDAERERGARERPAAQWAEQQAERLGLESISAGIGRAVGGLGDVIVDIKSDPGVLPLVAEVRAEYQGRLLESRGVEGDAAIKAAVDEYAGKIQQARERMAARAMADERGLPADAPPAVAAPTNATEPPQQTRPERLIELRKRQSVLKQLLECLG